MLGGLWLQGHRGRRIRQVEACYHHMAGAMVEVQVGKGHVHPEVHPEVHSEDHDRCR